VHVRRGDIFEKFEVASSELPFADTSFDWFKGKRQHLPLARIGAPIRPEVCA